MARPVVLVMVFAVAFSATVVGQSHTEEVRIATCALGLTPNYFLLQTERDFRKATKRMVHQSGKAGATFVDVAGANAEYLNRESVDQNMSLTEATSIYVSYLEPDVRKEFFKCVNPSSANRVEASMEAETDTEVKISVKYFGPPNPPATITVQATKGVKISPKTFSLGNGGSQPVTLTRNKDASIQLSFQNSAQVPAPILNLRPPVHLVWVPLKFHPITGERMTAELTFHRDRNNRLPLPAHAFFCGCYGFEATRLYEGGHSFCNPGQCVPEPDAREVTFNYTCTGPREQDITFYVYVLREFQFNADSAPPPEKCDSDKPPKPSKGKRA